MTTYTDKRASERCTSGAPVRLTHYHTGRWLAGQTLNHCTEGMCVKSNLHVQPGTAILIRVEHFTSNGSCIWNFEGLPTMILGEVKWCQEIPDGTPFSYAAGVKYFLPDY